MCIAFTRSMETSSGGVVLEECVFMFVWVGECVRGCSCLVMFRFAAEAV